MSTKAKKTPDIVHDELISHSKSYGGCSTYSYGGYCGAPYNPGSARNGAHQVPQAHHPLETQKKSGKGTEVSVPTAVGLPGFAIGAYIPIKGDTVWAFRRQHEDWALAKIVLVLHKPRSGGMEFQVEFIDSKRTAWTYSVRLAQKS